MAGYTLERTELGDKWDAFVESSPNGTLFSLSKYLEATRVNTEQWFCTKGNRTVAAVSFVVHNGNPVLHDFVVYSGLMHALPESNQNISQVRSERFKVAEFIAGELPKYYKTMEFALHPSVRDIRPFLWHNYGQESGRYRAEVRYTSHYALVEFYYEHFTKALSWMSQSRRQEIQYARRDGIRTILDYDVSKFMGLYLRTMGKQGISLTKKRRRDMSKLLAGLAFHGLARMYSAQTPDGLTGSMAVFGFDDKRAYWLWGANDPDMRDSHCGTAVVWDAMQDLAMNGITEIDLEGCNSPARGWFKLSFGGTLDSYYELRYVR